MNGCGVALLSATCLGLVFPVDETVKNVRIKTIIKVK